MTHSTFNELEKLSKETLQELMQALSKAVHELDHGRSLTEMGDDLTEGYIELYNAQTIVWIKWRNKELADQQALNHTNY